MNHCASPCRHTKEWIEEEMNHDMDQAAKVNRWDPPHLLLTRS